MKGKKLRSVGNSNFEKEFAKLKESLETALSANQCDNNHNENLTQLTWLTYKQAALYTGWKVSYLRNLVSAGQIPVYGKNRSRRFRRDMLDLFLTNPDVAMRKFRQERNTHGN